MSRGLGRSHAPHLLVVVTGIVALLVTMEAAARVVVYGLEYWATDSRINADGYGGADWTKEYYREFRDSAQLEWEPFVYWRSRPYAGRFINIDARGHRRTWAPPSLPAMHPRVFVFGGSTVWGSGARDDYTMPSLLARGLADSGRAAEVVNYGDTGYVSRQSLTLLMTELFEHRVPDVVVIEAGVEDTFSALQSGRAGIPQNEDNRRIEFNAAQPERVAQQWQYATAGLTTLSGELRRMLLPGTATAQPVAASAGDALAADVVDTYCSEVRTVVALGREYGFLPVFIWQPVAFTKQQPTAYERSATRAYEYARPFFTRVYQRVHDQGGCRGAQVDDLSHLFDREDGPMFLDAFHLTEEGNRRLAAAILPSVATALPSSGPPDSQ